MERELPSAVETGSQEALARVIPISITWLSNSRSALPSNATDLILVFYTKLVLKLTSRHSWYGVERQIEVGAHLAAQLRTADDNAQESSGHSRYRAQGQRLPDLLVEARVKHDPGYHHGQHR